MSISSKQNPRFKSWKKLQSAKGRREQKRFIVEGEHLLQEAVRSDWTILEVITTENVTLPDAWLREDPSLKEKWVKVSSSLFADLSEIESHQGAAMVIQWPALIPMQEQLQNSQCILLVDEVRDPGNMGTMIRTADAAGVDAIVVNKRTVDIFSGKVIRSTQGSIFHIPIYEQCLHTCIPLLQEQGWHVLGTSLRGAEDYRSVKLPDRQQVALLVGNEGYGVNEELLALTQHKIKVPIWGNAESLNVAIATGILLYHIQGQMVK